MAAIAGTSGDEPLARIRFRLTTWFVATFSVILLALGAGLFAYIRHQYLRQLDSSLELAVTELIRAARIREIEADSATGVVVDAVDELRIPERQLYLLDAAGQPVRPASAPPWIRQAAAKASTSTPLVREVADDHDRRLLLHARRFTLASGTPMVAVVAADKIELQDRYASLIAAFGGAALAALLLVAGGTALLVQTSMRPMQQSLDRTRQFMADAAHELRTPLAVIQSRAEVALQQERPSASYITVLHSISDDARRLGTIVADLLTLSRADAGERPIARQRLFLDDVAAGAAESAQPLAQQRGVVLVLEEFEETVVTGDGELLRQLVMILLDNAIKFTGHGGQIRVRVAPRDAHPSIEIQDTGIGMAAAHVPRIFDRFYRVDPTRHAGAGAGLGLSIARWIADAHGASIVVDTTEGGGTRMQVTFPAAVSER